MENYISVFNIFFISVSLFLLALSFYITSFKLKFLDLSSSCLFFLSAVYSKAFLDANINFSNIIFISFSISFFISFIFSFFKNHGWSLSILGFFILLASMNYFDSVILLNENVAGAITFITIICSYFFVGVFPWLLFLYIKKENRLWNFILIPIIAFINIVSIYTIYKSGISFDKLSNINFYFLNLRENIQENKFNDIVTILIFSIFILIFALGFVYKIIKNFEDTNSNINKQNLKNIQYITMIFISSLFASCSGIIFSFVNNPLLFQEKFQPLTLPLNMEYLSATMLIWPIFYSIIIYILAKFIAMKKQSEKTFIILLFLSSIIFNLTYETSKAWNVLEYVKMITIIILIIVCDSQNIFLNSNNVSTSFFSNRFSKKIKKDKKISNETLKAISKQYI